MAEFCSEPSLSLCLADEQGAGQLEHLCKLGVPVLTKNHQSSKGLQAKQCHCRLETSVL